MISKKIIGALTILSLTGAIGGGLTVSANAQPAHKTPIKTNIYSNKSISSNSTQINFNKTNTIKILTQQQTQELLKNNKKVPHFSNEQEAQHYFNNLKKEVQQNTNEQNEGNQFFYRGTGTSTVDLGTGLYAELNVPYGVTYNGTLGNYYSSVGRASVGLEGFTWGESMSSGYGSATIGNNHHTIYANGGGTLNSYILIKGIGQFYSSPFTISGQWTVVGGY